MSYLVSSFWNNLIISDIRVFHTTEDYESEYSAWESAREYINSLIENPVQHFEVRCYTVDDAIPPALLYKWQIVFERGSTSCNMSHRYVMNKKVAYKSKLAKDDDVMSVEDYLENVKSKAFIDYDGSGHPVKKGKVCDDIRLLPSDGKLLIPFDCEQVVWYHNR